MSQTTQPLTYLAANQLTKYVTEREAAEFLGISTRTLQAWRIRGGGPVYIKLGRAVRYQLATLLTYAEERSRRHTSERISAALSRA